ncbi:hypothetical protein B9Z65_4360 [Elsinoe australis]|uniref:Uncharacterized protein n=1 Tax=Elsinoe australis TaxID=40998 RepID=A0A2P7Z2K5_9PEZI|nr:hypothetical protein B9Z65_4360 [Elsinoe australis]
MAATFVPTVTEEDLYAFHSKHFPCSHPPRQLFTSDGYTEQDEDGLGWYPDGVKRTITDEQVAIFRHSEVFKVIREREIAAAAISDEHKNEQQISAAKPGINAQQNIRREYSRQPVPLKDLQMSEVDRDTTGTVVHNDKMDSSNKGRPQKQKSAKHSKNWRKKRNVAKRKRQARAAQEQDQARNDDLSHNDQPQRASDASLDPQREPSNEVPKRKWTEYIDDDEDHPDQRTHRRRARELDEHQEETTELAYDD